MAPSSSLSTFPAALVITSSSLCLSLSLALLSLVFLKGEQEEEYSEGGVLATGAATLVSRWATVSATASAAGLVGVLRSQRVLLRLFAVIAAFDLLCTLLLLLVLLLLTYVPTLSVPFSTFLCGALTGGSPDEGLNLWGGLEVCEENWRVVMLVIAGGAAVAIGFRAWATALIWQHYGAVARVQRSSKIEEEGWFDLSAMDHERKENLRRVREVTEARQRSSTLPILLGMHGRERPLPRHHGRFKSHSVSGGTASTSNHQPQLVLVPIFVDSPPPSSFPDGRRASQSSFTSEPPAYSSHSRTPSSSRSSSRSSSTSSSSRPYFDFTSEPDSYTSSSSPEISPSPKQRYLHSRSRSDAFSLDSLPQQQNALGLSMALEEVTCR